MTLPIHHPPGLQNWHWPASGTCSKGHRRAVPDHGPDPAEFALLLARREGLKPQPDGSLTRPPRLDSGHRVDWPDLLRFVDALLEMLGNRREPLERRLRKCLTLAREMRKA